MRHALLQCFTFLLLLAGISGSVAAQSNPITIHDFVFDGYTQGSGYPASKLNSGPYTVSFSAVVSKPSSLPTPNRAYVDIRYDYSTAYGQVLYGSLPLANGTLTTTTVNGVLTDNIEVTGSFFFDPNTIRSPRGGWYSLFAVVSYYKNQIDTEEINRAYPPVYFPTVISTQPGTPTNPPTQQGPFADGDYLIRNRWSGQVVEVGSGSNTPATQGAAANQWPSNGNTNQQWAITSLGNGRHRIINKSSNLALEVLGGGTQPGNTINQWAYHNGNNQSWLFQPINGSPGFYTITNTNSGLVMEVAGGGPYNTTNGAHIKQWTYYGAGTNHQEQEWELIRLPTTPTSNAFPGVYTITNVNSNQLLEMGGYQPGPFTAGNVANQWSSSGTSNQHWTFVDLGNGFYEIVNRGSGMALEVRDGSTNPGTTINQWPYQNTQHQQWAISQVSPGVYAIINRNSNQAMEIGGGSTKGGAYANQWYYQATSHQHWYINFFAQNRMAAPTNDGTTVENQSVENQPLAFQVFPNPASGAATISYSLPAAASVSINITDAMGWRVTKVLNGEHQEAGDHSLPTPDLGKGIYTIRFTANDVTEYRKLVIE